MLLDNHTGDFEEGQSDFIAGGIVDNHKFWQEELRVKPYCTNPLTVAKGEKLRLVLDMRNVNKHLIAKTFRYENLRTVRDIIEENDYFATFDLKSGNHHIPIAAEHQKYFGFAWDFPDKTRFFIFVVLAFGLAPAGYVFSKVMRPLTKKWRTEGKRSSLYLDDGIIVGGNAALTEKTIADIVQDMIRAGSTKPFKIKANAIPKRVLFRVSYRHTTNGIYSSS